ncbi:MAG: NAD(P)H-dependent oxidoreductase [Chloroflexota bacterium]|nr:MAG: NAD(P)H-dependent oxidoreductase [Chloroflexota bacterium]
MASPVHLLGISGSLRRRSFNTALLRAAGEMLPESVTLDITDLAPIPFYNEDIEQEQGFPEPVQHLRAAIAACDAILFAVPEYNYSITGVLKNAIDWASRSGPGPRAPSPLRQKPFGMMGVGSVFGTVRAQMHMRQITLHNDMRALSKPDVLLARAGDKFDADLRLTDEPTRKMVGELVVALVAWTRQLRGG